MGPCTVVLHVHCYNAVHESKYDLCPKHLAMHSARWAHENAHTHPQMSFVYDNNYLVLLYLLDYKINR